MLRTGETSLAEGLEHRGISRRAFMRFCGAMVATLALPASYTDAVAQALLATKRPILLWREFQDCAGNSESMLRSSHPDILSIVLDLLSLDYHETVMAGAGKQAEAVIEQAMRSAPGQYIAIIEGSIPVADGGVYCTVGGRTALDLARELTSQAAATIAIGACAWDGGLVKNGPTGALGVGEAIPGIKNLVNLGGCPHNPANTAAVITHYLTFGTLPALDQYRRPLFAYGELIHDHCERRAHFDAGHFVEAWGDEGARKGWCLYKMGCKGPAATYNCPVVRWNDGTSWPVQAGHGCIGCASPRFWDQMSPFYGRLPGVTGFASDVNATEIGLGFTGAVAAAFAAHGVGSAIRARLRPLEAEEPAEPGAAPAPEPATEKVAVIPAGLEPPAAASGTQQLHEDVQP